MPVATFQRSKPTTKARAHLKPSPAALARSFHPAPAFHPVVQAKLKVGTPNDRYEQEADRVADQVMGMPQPGSDTARLQPLPVLPETICCQSDTEPPTFPDFPNLALKLEEDVGRNLLDYGHHLYRISTLYPERTDLLEEAFGRYALGANVLETGFRFLGLDQRAAERFALGSGILFKGLTFGTEGELVLDFQFDIGRGLKLETSVDLAVNPDDYGDVRKAEVGLGLVGRF